jgi:D,D-heptose 1,7-bisphosphate phosphatase
MNKAIFIDKDGTLIEDVSYNIDPAKIRFSVSSLEGLRAFKAEGYLLIVITNQSGIARGFFDIEAFNHLRIHIDKFLSGEGIIVDDWFICPHHAEGSISQYAIECNCRKPKPGLILNAAKKFNIALDKSWMIGDILHDIEAGNSAGCRTILIDNGNETEWHYNYQRKPTQVVKTINEAASYILQEELV